MSDAKGSRDRGRTPAVGERRQRAALWVAVAMVVVATVVAYANSLSCPFVFDDASDIVGNHSIRRLRPLVRVFMAESGGKTFVRNRPVVNLTFALNYATARLEPLQYHVTNLAIHVLAGLTLFGIARRTLCLPSLAARYAGVATPLACLIALAWALHPLQTESVTYVTQRYESLMGLFYLLSLYCAIRGDSSRHRVWWAAASVTTCLAAMGSKEVAVSIPLVILLYDRAFMAGSFAEAWRRRPQFYVAMAATWGAMALHQVFSGGRSSWAGFGLPTPPLDYARSQFGVILHYLRLSFWPYPQVFDYAWPVARTAGQIVPGIMVVGGLLAATAYALVRRPMWGTLGAWFFLILAPTSSIMPIADLAFEHRMYLPLVAVVAATVIAAYGSIGWIEARFRVAPWGRKLLRVAPALAVVGALGIATHCRNRVYESDWSVWYDTVQKAPKNPRAYCNLGYAYFVRGKTDEAIAYYRKSLQMENHYAHAHYVMGFVFDQQGRTDEAIWHYRKALRIDPKSAATHYNLAIILRRVGEVDEAIAHYRQAIDINPLFANAHYNLGNAYSSQGKIDEAIVQYRKTLELEPSHAEAQAVLDRVIRTRERRTGGSLLLGESPFLPR